jgi:beta-glucanase (GH16 family)
MARITGPPGACAGIFTYRPPTSTAVVQEADLEILTSEPWRVQLTNQPVPQNVPIHGGSGGGNASTESATQNVTLPANGNWNQWNVYRVDWIEGRSVWYLNGVVLGEINVQAPRDPAGVIVNLWSDGGLWSGGMGKGNSATMDVQWIEMAFNTSGTTPSSSRKGKRDAGGCKTVCGIDDAKVTAVGTPVVLWGAAGAVSTFASSTLLLLVLGSLGFVEALW